MKNRLTKLGSFGAVIAAAACPFCFPKLAMIGAIFGFGALLPFETALFYVTQVFILLALVGHVLSYRKIQNRKLLSLALVSTVVFFISLYIFVSEILSYLALLGLIISTIWLLVENRHCTACQASPD